MNQAEILSKYRMLPFPSEDELKRSEFSPDVLKISPLLNEDIDDSFENIQDLGWLREPASNAGIVILGENHYFQAIEHLRNRILFALNTFDRYPLLLLEIPYSETPFLNHYLSIENDRCAAEFYSSSLRPFIRSQETAGLVAHIRRWNQAYPDRRIRLGGYDIEHYYINILKSIILPYLRRIEPAFELDPGSLRLNDLELIIPAIRNVLNGSGGNRVDSSLEFMNLDYIRCVMDNIESSYHAYRYQIDYYRQKAIVRNLSDPRFFGDDLRMGKVLIHCGSFHGATRLNYPDGGNFLREGAWLAHEHEPSREKTVSIRLLGISLDVSPMAGIDLNDCIPIGNTYSRLISRYQSALSQKCIRPGDHFIFNWDRMDEFDRLLCAATVPFRFSPVLVEQTDWNKIFESARQKSVYFYNEMRDKRDYFDQFDYLIVAPQSKIIRALHRSDR